MAITLSSVLIILLLVLLNIATGCSSSTPSEEEMAEAILSHLTRSASGLSDSPCRPPQAVEVIDVLETTEKNKMTTWSVTVNVMCPNKEEQARYVIFKDVFGDIEVLRRIG